MLKALLVGFAIVSAILGAPITDDAQATITSYENINDGSGNYKFSYETSNGLFRKETGELVNAGQPDAHIVVRGSFSYTDTNGKEQIIEYVADENGYHIKEPIQVIPISGPPPPSVIASLLG